MRTPREDIDVAGYIKVLGKGGVDNLVPVEEPVIRAIPDWVTTHSGSSPEEAMVTRIPGPCRPTSGG